MLNLNCFRGVHMRLTFRAFVLTLAAVFALATPSFAVPFVFNDDIAGGTAFFDAAVIGNGGTVFTDALSGLDEAPADGLFDGSIDRGVYTIASTDGAARFVDLTYLASGESIGINPSAVSPELSGLTFTFDTPINAFGLEIGDWATCCHPSALYIAFGANPAQLVASALSAADNPGVANGDGFLNFVGAVDDTGTFTTVTFFGDGFGEYLVAGGTIRWGVVEEGEFDPGAAVPEPGSMLLLGSGLIGAAFVARRRKKAEKQA